MKNLLIQIFSILAVLSLLTACSDGASSGDVQEANPAVFMLVENGGSVMEEDKAHAAETALHVLQQLSALRKRKATANTPIYLIFSAKPNVIAWSGIPAQLHQQAQQVRDLLTFRPSFSDLEMSMFKIATTIKLARIDKARLIWIGPAISVPYQETHGEALNVVVPQALSDNLALKDFADKLVTLRLLNTHPDQQEMVSLWLEKHGILEHEGISFSLKGQAQTKASLKDLL